MKNLFDAHKFSPSEIFSSNNGKTSATQVIGFIASIVCLILFMILVIFYLAVPAECANILLFVDKTITYFTVSAGLLGVKSVTSAFGKLPTITVENSTSTTSEKNVTVTEETTEVTEENKEA